MMRVDEEGRRGGIEGEGSGRGIGIVREVVG